MPYLILALLLAGCITDPPPPKVHNVECVVSRVDSVDYNDTVTAVHFHACEFPDVKPPAPK